METQTFRNAQHNPPTAVHNLVELNIEVGARKLNKIKITVDRGRCEREKSRRQRWVSKKERKKERNVVCEYIYSFVFM